MEVIAIRVITYQCKNKTKLPLIQLTAVCIILWICYEFNSYKCSMKDEENTESNNRKTGQPERSFTSWIKATTDKTLHRKRIQNNGKQWRDNRRIADKTKYNVNKVTNLLHIGNFFWLRRQRLQPPGLCIGSYIDLEKEQNLPSA